VYDVTKVPPSHRAHTSALLSWLYIIHIRTYTFVSRRARCTQHNHPRIPSYYTYRYILYVRTTHTTYILLLYSCSSCLRSRHVIQFYPSNFILTLPPLCVQLYTTLRRPPSSTIPAAHPPPTHIYFTKWISAGSQKTTLFPGNSTRARQII